VADEAEVGDGLAEGLALFGVFDGGGDDALAAAGAGRAEFEAADVEDVEGDDVAAADFT